MTRYVFAYDLEDPNLCLRAAPRLVEPHRRHEVPATFFVLGTVLEERGAELRRIFGDDPLFDLASLTYSHKLLKDNRVHGPGVGLEELGREIELGIRLVEDTFERPCVGVRSGYGFHGGLRGERERLEVVWDRGALSQLGPAGTGRLRSRRPGAGFPLRRGGVPRPPGAAGAAGTTTSSRASTPARSSPGRPSPAGASPTGSPHAGGRIRRPARLGRSRARAGTRLRFARLPSAFRVRMSPDCRVVELLMRYARHQGMATTTYGGLYHAYSALDR